MSRASDQITEYLSVGGLFNPELMNQYQHEAVRDTLVKARDDIQKLKRENAALREDKEALDWIDENVEAVFFKLEPDKFRLKIRETFKRARAKEAKP